MIKEYKELKNYEIMNDFYEIKKLSCYSIGTIIGCSSTTVRKSLIKLGINLRATNRKDRKNKSYEDKSYLIGRKTDMLEVISIDSNLLTCKCKCGNILNLEKRRITYDKQKSCGCLMTAKGVEHHRWRGGKYISLRYFSKLRIEAKRRKMKFDISLEYVENIFEKQMFKCKLSGLEISFSNRTASVDRIDSSLGYVDGNIQILHPKINEMKWDYSQSDFIEWCRLVTATTTSTHSL